MFSFAWGFAILLCVYAKKLQLILFLPFCELAFCKITQNYRPAKFYIKLS